MKIFIMTDIEGVCGVINHEDWAKPEGKYYEEGKRLLTLEVNAAVEGFYAAGATEIMIVDGHGYGAVNQSILDSRTLFVGRTKEFPGPYPFLLDETFDAIAWVGQHAKSGAPYAHLPHTGMFHVLDEKINGVSVGEFGEMAMIAGFLGVYPIFVSGDEALCLEARELLPGIETAAVKKGVTPGTGDECDRDTYYNRNLACVHLHPEKAGQLIREHAEKALVRFIRNRNSFKMPGFKPPFRREISYRPYQGKPAFKAYAEHPDNLIEMMNLPCIIWPGC